MQFAVQSIISIETSIAAEAIITQQENDNDKSCYPDVCPHPAVVMVTPVPTVITPVGCVTSKFDTLPVSGKQRGKPRKKKAT